MQLSQFTDFALRTLICVALERDALVPVAQIAARYDISRNHVVKIVSRLHGLGYLATHRGRNGGVALAREPAAIRIGALVAELENLALVECMTTSGTCVIEGACRLRHALARARDAFLAALDEHTLADLLVPRSRLRSALALG